MDGMISLLKELWSNLLHPDYKYFAATRLTKCRSFAFVVLILVGAIITHSETARAACSGGPCVGAGPRLASVDSSRSVLLNALLGDLLGTSLNLTVADWNAIAQGDVNLASYLNALKTQVAVSSPSQALSANATLAQLVSAMAVAAQADGNTALVNALNSLKPQVAGLSGTIKLGDLLSVSLPNGALSSVKINALDLVTGAIQLYNYRNLLTTPSPVTISGSAIGLGSVINSVQLYAQIIEPPTYVCGGAGTQFHTGAVRVKLNVDLIDLQPNASALNAPPTISGASVTIAQVQLYVEVARAEGTIAGVDAVSHAVTVQATPGVADLYLGTISDSVFFNRAHVIDASIDLDYSTIGTLSVNATTVNIQAKSYARGQAPFTSSLFFAGPYPQTQTASTSAAFASNLVDSLVTNLSLRLSPLSPSLGALDSIILPTLKTIVSGAITPALNSVLTGLVDPVLELLGIRLGEVDVTVFGYGEYCPPNVTLIKSVSPGGVQMPGADLLYSIVFSNTGGSAASNMFITDPVPPNTDFKIGSVTNSLGTTGLSVAVSYSNDSGATWTYTPVSGAGGAPANYDRVITNVRWSLSGSLSQTSPNNSGTISFTVQIR
jgi:uncharacterized repeat protein (TIGR01451 family)